MGRGIRRPKTPAGNPAGTAVEHRVDAVNPSGERRVHAVNPSGEHREPAWNYGTPALEPVTPPGRLCEVSG
ncbi:hypothetical protein ES703_60577 [subsurface metagenome]